MGKLIKNVGFVMIATLIARALGFVREMMLASKFGTSTISDSFIVALSIPDLLINGFGTAIATLYIPMYYKLLKEKKENVSKFNFNIISVLMMIAAAVIILFQLFPKQFILIFASGFDNEASALTIKLTRVMIWSTIPIMLAYFYRAYAQIEKKFAVATLVGCITNLTIIISLLIVDESKAYVLGYGALLGNVLYAVALNILLRGTSYSSKPTWHIFNEHSKELLLNVVPVCFSNLVYEINQILDKNFASMLVTGTISALNYSTKIINLITAIFGTSIASVVYPRITKIHSRNDEKKEAEELVSINSAMLLVLFPIAMLVAVFSKMIISLLFARGKFDATSLALTSECLIFYALGIIGFNLKSIWVRTFNARLDTKTPAINSAIAVAVNLMLNILLISKMQHRGLALATAVSSLLTDALLIRKYAIVNKNFKIADFGKNTLKQMAALIAFVPCILLDNHMAVIDVKAAVEAMGLSIICSFIYLGINLLLKETTVFSLYERAKDGKVSN